MESDLSIEGSVTNLLYQMKIEEKIARMKGYYFQEFMEAGNSKLMKDMVFSKEKAENIIREGEGQCVSIFNGSTIVVADNFFDKTRKNILSGCKGLFFLL